MLAIRPEAGYGRFLVSQLSNPDSLVMVAENFGTVVGYVLADVEPTNWMELRGPCGVVQDVYVDEAARRLGAGRLLMRAAIAWVRSKGRSQVVLLTKTRNEHAQQWKKASSAKLPDATALLAATQRIG